MSTARPGWLDPGRGGQAGVEVKVVVACGLLTLAAFAGHVSGYETGRAFGPGLYRRDGRFVKGRCNGDTRRLFDERGSVALVLGRFIPIVRTFVTLVAGVSALGEWVRLRSPTAGRG